MSMGTPARKKMSSNAIRAKKLQSLRSLEDSKEITNLHNEKPNSRSETVNKINSDGTLPDYSEESLRDFFDKEVKFRTEVLGLSREEAEEWTRENIKDMKEIRAKMRDVHLSISKKQQ